jgi:iron(II)-dependent oxidoreductase
VAEHIRRFRAEPGKASEAALDEIFAGDDVSRIWDTQFVDLPTVVRWREVNVEVELRQLELERLRESEEDEIPPPEDMVLVPGGRFLFGPHDLGWTTERKTGRAARYVTLKPYYIDRHEVTNKAYAEFLARKDEKERAALTPAGWSGDPPTFPPVEEHHPVTGVTFAQASAYAAWARRRLPTEAEWEKAARGAEPDDRKDRPRLWPWGFEFDPDALVWGGNRAAGPARILARRRDRSPYFVRDMAGNVAEWTTTLGSGLAEVSVRPEQTDVVVIRGASFRTTEKEKTTVTWRWVLPGATGQRDDVGFRCVLDEAEWRRRRRGR